MKSTLAFLLLVAAQLSFAQIFEIKTIEKNTDERSYQFPLVQSSQRPAIAKIINTSIQTDIGADPISADPFATVGGEDEYSFHVFSANERVLSMVVTGSHSGAGYHVTRHKFNFDARTGKAIDLDLVFGTEGNARLKKALLKSWKNAIKANMNDREEYKECWTEAEKATDLYFDRAMIRDDGISVWAGNCLDGSQYESDRTAGPHEYSFGQLLPMLTPYGYSLFTTPLTTGPIKTLLRGTVDNKYPISMTLFPGTPKTLTGMIVYDRVGEPLNLVGTMTGNQIVLHEVDEKNVELSTIEVTWDGAKLGGMFTNLKTKKQMVFVVEPVQK